MSGLSRGESFLTRASSNFPLNRTFVGEEEPVAAATAPKRQKRNNNGDSHRILLIRHGQSLGNVEPRVYRETADHAIELSAEGKQQAHQVGQFLQGYLEQLGANDDDDDDDDDVGAAGSIKILVSPYKRARNTAEIIRSYVLRSKFTVEEGERVELGEIQFGLFEGLSLAEIAKEYPLENEHFNKLISHGGRFYARFPLGESRCDVALRTKTVVDEIRKEGGQDDPKIWIIVSHGLTLRAFLQGWCERTVEWLEVERNPRNCSVRLISESGDQGYIYPGSDSVHVAASTDDDVTPTISKEEISRRIERMESEISELKKLLE